MKKARATKKQSTSFTLKHQDCLTFLRSVPTGSVDLVVIDPPYGVSRKTGFKSVGKKGVARLGVSTEFGSWDYDVDDLVADTIKECYRVLRKGGTLVCFYDLWKLTNLSTNLTDSKFKQIRFIEWIKTNPVPINSKVNYLTNSREIALVAVKGGKGTFNSKYDNGVYSHPITREKRFHPTQKPIKLIKELVEKHSNVGDLVLDCFSGSGTTAHACFETGRNFVGCELDKTYHTKSVARLLSAGVSDVVS